MNGLRCVLVGCGGMGKSWIRNLLKRNDIDLAALVDIRPGAAEAARDEIGDPRLLTAKCGTDFEALLSATRPDFVVDVTVPESHVHVTLAALSAGVHVLGEKPMASTMADARRMVHAARASGKTYMVSQSRRFLHQQSACIRAIRSGAIGQLHTVNADFYLGPHFGGFRDQMPSPLIVDMAIHTFDQARYLADADATYVYAHEYNPPGSWYRGAASAVCVFEMEHRDRSTGEPWDVLFTYRGSWCAEGAATSWDASWRLIGSHGTIVWDGTNSPTLSTPRAGSGFMREQDVHTLDTPPEPTNIEGSLAEFLAALREGRPPRCHAEDNIKSLAMVFAALESSQRKQRVAVDAAA